MRGKTSAPGSASLTIYMKVPGSGWTAAPSSSGEHSDSMAKKSAGSEMVFILNTTFSVDRTHRASQLQPLITRAFSHPVPIPQLKSRIQSLHFSFAELILLGVMLELTHFFF